MAENRQRGFTLIELSIVLVIIGLIVGGILVGQDMIQAAKRRSVITEVEKIKAAVNTFHSKYNCLPGDCANAASFGLGANGNGDGMIGVFPGIQASEMPQFWLHLSNAGLIPGSYTGVAGPTNPRDMQPGINIMASRWGSKTGYTVVHWKYTDSNDWIPPVYGNVNGHVIEFGTQGTFGGQYYETQGPGIDPLNAQNIDAKIDDGSPGTGTVLYFFPIYYPGCVTTNNPANSVYIVTNNNPTCSMVFTYVF